MMHLASQRKEVEKPSVFDLACRILKDVIRLDPHATYLWTHGRWHPASLDEVMRRANQRLKNLGRPQFTQKREWIVR
jgi:hypothetical protein